jgi:diguanylate cyclase (GGDEF)-like protein
VRTVRKDSPPIAMKKRLRRFLSPLASDSLATLNLPPVRVGLLTKVNLLTVGVIVLTAAATSSFYLARLWTTEDADVRARATTIVTMLAAISERGFYPANDTHTERILDSLATDVDLAYVGVEDAQQNTLMERRFGTALGTDPLPPLPAPELLPAAGTTRMVDLTIRGRRYVELIALASDARAVAAGGASPAPDTRHPVVYVRLGMVSGRTAENFRMQLMGTLTVVSLVLLAAIGVTLAFTRRMIAPMQKLMRAAKAVGSGNLDVQVPVQSSDELGLLTHTFNNMTQRLAQAQSEVASYQRTLEEKVAQRTNELEIASAEAYRLAQHDILTGLPNRSLLNQQLAQVLAQARRDGHHVACLFLDFDHFKRINDTLGHDSGDLLLQMIAERLSGAVRESDILARLGGDEFVVILPGLDPAHVTFETMTVLSRIRESLLAPFKLADQMPTLTCSVGVSMYPIDAEEPVNLIKQADTAMYAAKEAGRNAYRFYTSDMNARVQARLQLETDMRRGMIDNEFFLVFQPQVEMKTGRASGVEALLRWRDPVRGIIAPTEFIPVAEESGMIQALGARALRDACRQVMHWHRENMLVRLSVNLSVQQLQHDRWLTIVADALRASGLKPQYLDLEITESVIITHPDKAVATLIKLKEMGVSVTVDDFGTGYSSLSYLARLPLQGVKIDQRFVSGLGQDRVGETITQAIIALSHSLGLRVVAEGVETDAQFNFLKKHGCDEAQGYLISRPLDAAQLRTWWRLQADHLRDADRHTGLA